MPSTHKKVVVRKMDRDSISGYVAAQFVNEGKLELLNTAGNVVAIDLREIKGVYFVREFGDSESLTRKTFTSRPRAEGLWVRLRFKDNEILEGLMPADLTQNLARRISYQPARPALQHPAHLRPAQRARFAHCPGRDWRRPPPAPPRRSAPGPHVRGVKPQTGSRTFLLRRAVLVRPVSCTLGRTV